jgi:predicted transcriptional regulator
MHPDLLQYVLDQLESRKGQWPAIAEETGVPYDTITKIAQGQIEDPKVSKVQRLANYFREKAAA